MNEKTKKIYDSAMKARSSERELDELRRDRSIKENLEREIKVLMEIFPKLTAEDIPDEVFERCPNGKGLAGEYALWHLKNGKKKEEAAEKNEKNTRSAPPKVSTESDDRYFTPDAVRAMSADEVRRNYSAIMKSMEKWNNKKF